MNLTYNLLYNHETACNTRYQNKSDLNGIELAGELAPATVPRTGEIKLLLAPTAINNLVHVEAGHVCLQRVTVRKTVCSAVVPL